MIIFQAEGGGENSLAESLVQDKTMTIIPAKGLSESFKPLAKLNLGITDYSNLRI